MIDSVISNLKNSMTDDRAGGRTGAPGAGGLGHMAAGAAAGSLATMLMGGGKPKKLAKNALKLGSVALVGGLAYKAWSDWRTRGPAPQIGQPDNAEALFMPPSQEAEQTLARILARAMITAAKADGRVSLVEKKQILTHLDEIGATRDVLEFIDAEISAPFNVEAVLRDATTPERAIEIYAASALAVDGSGAAEQGYLSMLSARLQLEPSLVEEIHTKIAESGVQAA